MPEELPLRLEAGTQNAAGIAGLLAGVCFVLKEGVLRIREHEMALSALLIAELRDVSGIRVLGPADPTQRVAVVSIVADGYVPDQLALVLDRVFGVMTRAGLHCAPQAHRTAGSLDKGGALRLSPGFFNTEEEIRAAAEALRSILSR